MYIAVIVAIMHVRSYVNYFAFSFYADMHTFMHIVIIMYVVVY